MNLLSFFFHRFLLVICVLSFSLMSHAQNAAFAWGRGISGNGIMWPMSSTADAAGNVYTVGYFSGTADFDPGPNTMNLTAAGSSDAFISKLNANGNFVWVIPLSGSGGDDIEAITLDAQGNIYICGYGSGNIDFDPGPGTVNPGGSPFVAKYDTNGNYIWVTRSVAGNALALDANGNVYIAAHYVNGPTYNTSLYANDTYIYKLNSTGVLQWSKLVSGKKEDLSWSIAVDGNGNVIVGGTTLSDTLDLDPGPGVYNITREGGGFDVFLIKLDSTGNFVWGGALTAEYPYGLKTDAGNNVYVTGFFGGMADFNPGPGTYHITSGGAADPYILKLNPDGHLVWVKQLPGTPGTFAYAKAMELDASGNIYTSGFVKGTFDMDPGPDSVMATSVAAGGPYVSKLDANGNFVWGKVFGGSMMAQSYGIGVDAAQNVYTTGFFKDTLDLDPGPDTSIVIAAPGAQGVFINKLMPTIGAPLPLTWLSVEGRLNKDQQATITWQAAETNVQGYTIEKSADGKAFNPIGSITAKGNGTHSYTFTEEPVLQQTAWYRILQTDIDARFSYSTIIRIVGGTTRSTITVYPVPARHQVTIKVTGDEWLHTKAVLIDRSGRPVKIIYLNYQETPLHLDNLAAGLYFLQLANGQAMKIMRQD
jgi:hypothetical protein